MGKKHIASQNSEELLKEREAVDAKVNKEAQIKPVVGAREGRIYISSSYNNTIISLTNEKGDALYWRSAGSIGFKGTKRVRHLRRLRLPKPLPKLLKKWALDALRYL